MFSLSICGEGGWIDSVQNFRIKFESEKEEYVPGMESHRKVNITVEVIHSR